MPKENSRHGGNTRPELATRWHRLSKEDRLICLWKHLGFSDAEIATQLGKRVSVVGAAYGRARTLMRLR